MLKFFEKHRQQRENTLFTDGYTYAAGQLLTHVKNGGAIEAMLSRLTDEANCPFDKTSFDKGILEAVSNWEDFISTKNGAT